MKKIRTAFILCLTLLILFNSTYVSNALGWNNIDEEDKSTLKTPDNCWVFHLKAVEYMEKGDYIKALAYSNTVLDINPGYEEIYNVKAEVLMEMGRYNSAIYYLDKSISISKISYNTFYACYLKAEALIHLHRCSEALASLDKAAKLGIIESEYFNDYYDTRGYCLLLLNRYDEALKCFDKVLENKPTYTDAIAWKANALYNLGEYDEALELCETALAMDNTLSDVYYTKSLIYLKKNDDLDCMLNLMVAGMRSTRYKEGYLLDPIFNDIGTTKEYIGIYGCVVRFNGKEILLKAQPEFIGNSAMIALEDICSQIGCSLKIDKKTNQYTIHNKAITISFRPNNRYAYVNGKKIDMKEKTIYKNNCLLVPVDFIGSQFKFSAEWNPSLKTLYIATPDYSQKNIDMQKDWALATSGIIMLANGWKVNIIGGGIPTPTHKDQVKKILMDSWDIDDKNSSMETIQWLKDRGHRVGFTEGYKKYLSLSDSDKKLILKIYENRIEEIENFLFYKDHGKEIGSKSLIAWDYCRIIQVAGMSYVCGYLSYDEAWKEIMDAAKVIQKSYSSWEDMARNYMLGGEFWSGDKYYISSRLNAYYWLLENENSPWKKLEWNTMLN
jgi:tetratricopeptide (TPR) repeat protein